jgi:hypothetical protein
MTAADRELARQARIAYREMGKESDATGFGVLAALGSFALVLKVVMELTGTPWLALAAALVAAYAVYHFVRRFFAALLTLGAVALVVFLMFRGTPAPPLTPVDQVPFPVNSAPQVGQ